MRRVEYKRVYRYFLLKSFRQNLSLPPSLSLSYSLFIKIYIQRMKIHNKILETFETSEA